MNKIKKFFNLDTADGYKFEWNDLRAFLQLWNVVLIIVNINLGSVFGFSIACLGLVKDLTDKDRRISGMLMHLLGIILNAYFIWWL